MSMTPMPHQVDGMNWCLDKNAALIAADMGTGKTGIACLSWIAWKSFGEKGRTLIICPATIKLNWMRELNNWVDSSTIVVDQPDIGIASGKHWPENDVVIINYDILHRHQRDLEDEDWGIVIIDESHNIRNSSALRTKCVVGGRVMEKIKEKGKPPKTVLKNTFKGIRAKRKIVMTGTPILNKPVEIFTSLKWLDKATWGNYRFFTERYCDAQPAGYGRATDVSGASNLRELHDRLKKTIMFRVLKKDVLKNLPPKIHQIIPLPAPDSVKMAIDEQLRMWTLAESTVKSLREKRDAAKVARNRDEYARLGMQLRSVNGELITNMSRARKDLGVSKIPLVVQHVEDILSTAGPDKKVVVFAHHTEVLHTLAAHFQPRGVAFIDGSTPTQDRMAVVDRFQTDPACRVAVLSILAAGVGTTMTASDHVVMAEADWRPGINDQAEDRTHRIGQTRGVLVQYLVYDGSVDAIIIQRNIEKQKIIDSAIDGKEPVPTPFNGSQPTLNEVTCEMIGKAMSPSTMAATRRGIAILTSTLNDPILGASEAHRAAIEKLDALDEWTAKQAGRGLQIVRLYSGQLPPSVRLSI